MHRLFLLMLAGVVCLAAQEKTEKREPGTLKVNVSYTGSGTVDAKHPVFVFLFDSPDFIQGGVMPLAVKAASSKTETMTFPDLTAAKVYLAASYTADGSYDGQSGPPPSGSSMGLYGKTPGTPDAVQMEPGKTVEAALTFDDSSKMP